MNKKKVKILHVITSLSTGGAEKLMVDLLPQIKNMDYDVELCLLNGEMTPFRKLLEHTNVRIFDFGKDWVYNIKNIFRLLHVIPKYDIVHTHNTAPQLFVAICSVLCSTILVTTEHSTSNRRRNWNWYAPVDRWMYSRYKRIICCSDKVRNNILTYIGANRNVCVVNNGVDISRFKNAQALVDFRNQFPFGSRLITMVARFGYQKDQDTIIKALRHLDGKYHLILVGDGERRCDLENLVKNLHLEERVHFLGIRYDVPSILKSSDYIAMSSHFEGLSLSSVEGMAVGKPMLASNVDGLTQVVEGAGVLFKEGDDIGFAQKIKELDGNMNLYIRVAERCMKRAELYDISKMAEGYIAVYKDVLER